MNEYRMNEYRVELHNSTVSVLSCVSIGGRKMAIIAFTGVIILY